MACHQAPKLSLPYPHQFSGLLLPCKAVGQVRCMSCRVANMLLCCPEGLCKTSDSLLRNQKKIMGLAPVQPPAWLDFSRVCLSIPIPWRM